LAGDSAFSHALLKRLLKLNLVIHLGFFWMKSWQTVLHCNFSGEKTTIKGLGLMSSVRGEA